MNAFMEGVITIALAVVGLAVISVLVSNRAQTAGVIQASASGFGNVLGVAESPVTGNSPSFSLAYPAANSLSQGFGS